MRKIIPPAASSTNKGVLQIAYLVAQAYGLTILGIAVGILTARGLSVEDRGSLAIVLMMSQLASRFCSIGFEQVVLRHRSDDDPVEYYYAIAFGSFIAIPFLVILSNLVPEAVRFLIFLFFVIILISVLRVNISFLIRQNRYFHLAVLNYSQMVSQIILYYICFYFKRLDAFLFAWIFNITVFSIISTIIIVSHDKLIFNYPSISKIKGIWKSGLEYIGISLSEMAINFCIELPFIRSSLGSVQTGLYAISNTITSIYFQIFISVSNILAKGNISINKFLIYFGMLGIAFLFAIFAQPVISLLYGNSYRGASNYIIIMLPAIFLLGIARIEFTTSSQNLRTEFQALFFIVFVSLIILASNLEKSDVAIGISGAYAVYAISIIATHYRLKNLSSRKVR